MTMLSNILHRFTGLFHSCPGEEDLFEFALDGLDSPEQSKVRDHLSACMSCREQVKDFAWVSEGIALTAPQLDPPSDLCSKVKARIREDAAQPTIHFRDRPLSGWPLFWVRLGPVFAFMSVVMALSALVAFCMHSGSAQTAPALSEADALVHSASAKQLSLAGENGAKATLIYDEGRDTLLLNVVNLKPCPLAAAYTVWVNAAGKLTRLAGFQSESPKPAVYTLHLASPLALASKPAEFQVTEDFAGKRGAVQLHGNSSL